MRAVVMVLAALVLSGCAESKPAHYYVWCDDRDGNSWTLIDWEENEQGYVLTCTYQSPDKQQSYTARCTDSGCD